MKEVINNTKDVKIMNQSKSLIDSTFIQVGSYYYDVIEKDASKGDAVSHFCKIFNIKIYIKVFFSNFVDQNPV
jgi:hydroxymethylpyrimidine pyrophosphatase-like HAD family hydrolase